MTQREFKSVHDAHCCNIHGCKYGDKDCPVVLDDEIGIGDLWCEYCEDDRNNPTLQKALMADKMLAFMSTFKDRITRRYQGDAAGVNIAYGMEIVYEAFMQEFGGK
jgi:hypothetical protein